jgi:hypothetical protein
MKMKTATIHLNTDGETTKMSDSQATTPAQKAIGDFAPKLVSLTDD